MMLKKILETLPISVRFLKEIHHILLSGRRGEERYPGELRSSQNWIGSIGTTLATASFFPPNVDVMNEALSELEKYIHQDDFMDAFVKTVKTSLRKLRRPQSLIRYVTDRKGHDLRYAINPIKIENELGWKPKYNFESGITQQLIGILITKIGCKIFKVVSI